MLLQSTSYSCLLLLQYIVAVDIHNKLLLTLRNLAKLNIVAGYINSIGLVSLLNIPAWSGYQIVFYFPYQAGTSIGYFFELSYESGPAIESKTDIWLV